MEDVTLEGDVSQVQPYATDRDLRCGYIAVLRVTVAYST